MSSPPHLRVKSQGDRAWRCHRAGGNVLADTHDFIVPVRGEAGGSGQHQRRRTAPGECCGSGGVPSQRVEHFA